MNSCRPDELDLPDILLVLAAEVLIFDGLRGTLTLVTNADAACDHACEAALTHLDDNEATLITAPAQFGAINLDPSVVDCDSGTICYRTTQSEYEAWVEMIREYILEGEAMQLEPSPKVPATEGDAPVSLPGAQKVEPLALHVLSGSRRMRGDRLIP